MASVDPGILQTALLQVAEAARAAGEAAKAVQQAQAKAGALGPSSAASSTSVDWSKLINKPQAFDHASLEAEIIKSKTETPLVPSAPLVMNQNVPGSKLGCRRRVARQ
jgi:CRISPR/Cas system-associated exonuclease Cas4 (RecB family)